MEIRQLSAENIESTEARLRDLYRVVNLNEVRKRNGCLVPFIQEKIAQAIFRAAQETGEFGIETATYLTSRVIAILSGRGAASVPSVEEIQNVVEEVLLTSPFKRTAKAYIIYREHHALLRDLRQQVQSDLIATYLGQLDWKVRENSNMSFSLQGLNQFISSEVSKVYWLRSIYDEEVRDAHVSGSLHIHDLGLVGPYCVGWDLYELLQEGFRGVPGKVESGPPRHLRSALGQIVNFLYTLQGEAAGAQAFSNLDTLLAPFVRADSLSYEEVKQCMQEFIFNLNVPTRVGFQTPFTNITFDLSPPSYLKNVPAIVGGEITAFTYGDHQVEIDMLNRAFLEIMMQGDASGRVFTFPIPTYNVSEDFPWESPLLENLWKMTGKYGIPYFANFVNSDMDPDDARSMCCRLRLDNRELRRRGGGLFGSTPLTGSVGVVTLNLPRLGVQSSSESNFFDLLERQLRIAVRSLETKRTILEKFTRRGLYPYAAHYLRKVFDRFESYWANHFSTIGIIGMNEACLNLMRDGIRSKRGKDFATNVLTYLRDRLVGIQEETGNLFNLEATPAEAVSYRFAKLDMELYPASVCANEEAYRVGAAPYYTNSTQLPVDAPLDLVEALEHQGSLQQLYTGGTVFHTFLGQKVEDSEAVKFLVKTMVTTTTIPYITLTPTFSICPQCGYRSGEQSVCSDCGRTCEVYSRVVGYLRPVNQWNDGKQAEFPERKSFDKCVSAGMTHSH